MKCELTKKEVCYLSSFRGILISIKYSSELFKTREEFLNALMEIKRNEK